MQSSCFCAWQGDNVTQGSPSVTRSHRVGSEPHLKVLWRSASAPKPSSAGCRKVWTVLAMRAYPGLGTPLLQAALVSHARPAEGSPFTVRLPSLPEREDALMLAHSLPLPRPCRWSPVCYRLGLSSLKGGSPFLGISRRWGFAPICDDDRHIRMG